MRDKDVRSIQRVRGFTDPSNRFKHDFQQLNPKLKEKLKRVMSELIKGELSKGSRLKKLKGNDNQFSIRLNRHVRFVFERQSDGRAKPIAVAAHDRAYATRR